MKMLGKAVDLEGGISLQNGLKLARETLNKVPLHGHREILCLVAALSTCDPGDINETVKELKVAKILAVALP